MNLWGKILNLVYPDNNICLECNDTYLCSEIKGICDSCLQKIRLTDNYCQICGRELNVSGEEINLCSYCQKYPNHFEIARSVGVYDGLLKELLLKFKYDHFTELKRPLAHLLYSTLKYYYSTEKIDKIISVPIHRKRLEQRGYNQVELVAEELSQCTGISISFDICRIQNVPPLYNYAYDQRKNLLKDSFSVKKGAFKGQSLLLIDDIFTTGATTNEISSSLKDIGGAVRVIVLTVATAFTY